MCAARCVEASGNTKIQTKDAHGPKGVMPAGNP